MALDPIWREDRFLEPIKGKILLLGSEGIGEDRTLGFEILMALFETLIKRQDLPYAIILWNQAVKLLEEGNPFISNLKRLEEKGVRILAGKLCVDELEISNKLALGKIATMSEILDLILHYEVVTL